MTGTVEVGVLWRAWLATKHGATYLFVLGKRIATLEARVTELEATLEKQPPDACPKCGERAMRLENTWGLRGSGADQRRIDGWKCEKCGHQEQRIVKF